MRNLLRSNVCRENALSRKREPPGHGSGIVAKYPIRMERLQASEHVKRPFIEGELVPRALSYVERTDGRNKFGCCMGPASFAFHVRCRCIAIGFPHPSRERLSKPIVDGGETGAASFGFVEQVLDFLVDRGAHGCPLLHCLLSRRRAAATAATAAPAATAAAKAIALLQLHSILRVSFG